MIAIIDYEAGNLRSVQKAFEFIGADARLTANPDEILSSEAVVLPGVGAFRDCMDSLGRKKLQDVVRRAVTSGRPFLGICLGFQMLFDESEEHAEENGGNVRGLGLFRGCVRKLLPGSDLKVPHMGWNNLVMTDCGGKGKSLLFKGLPDKPFVYFVHSFYVDAADSSIVSAKTCYGSTFDVALSSGPVFGTQFHPEKSGDTGLAMLRNFLEAVRES
jgi:imidazole glycerol-phosphate synthase subunit HisH